MCMYEGYVFSDAKKKKKNKAMWWRLKIKLEFDWCRQKWSIICMCQFWYRCQYPRTHPCHQHPVLIIPVYFSCVSYSLFADMDLGLYNKRSEPRGEQVQHTHEHLFTIHPSIQHQIHVFIRTLPRYLSLMWPVSVLCTDRHYSVCATHIVFLLLVGMS